MVLFCTYVAHCFKRHIFSARGAAFEEERALAVNSKSFRFCSLMKRGARKLDPTQDCGGFMAPESSSFHRVTFLH